MGFRMGIVGLLSECPSTLSNTLTKPAVGTDFSADSQPFMLLKNEIKEERALALLSWRYAHTRVFRHSNSSDPCNGCWAYRLLAFAHRVASGWAADMERA